MSREIKEHAYATYPRRFTGYKWYKPIVFCLMFAAAYAVLATGVSFAAVLTSGDYNALREAVLGGYDTMDVYTAPGAILSLGSLAIIIPSIFIASIVYGDRPFSSYSSSRGGWNWKIFIRTFAAALGICGIPVAVYHLSQHVNGVNRFTVAGFICLTILGPLQCVAEEYLFRGIIIQTVGSWFKLTSVAVLVEVIVFASMHPYNLIGVIAIAVSGVCFGLSAVITKGLEAGAALHIVNNMTIFYMAGFGYAEIKTDADVPGLIVDTLINIAYVVFLFVIDKKFHWFDEVKKDDVAIYNEKKAEKAALAAKLKEQRANASTADSQE